MWINKVSLVVCVISLILSGYVCWQTGSIQVPFLPAVPTLLSYRIERAKILQESSDTMQNDLYTLQNKYVDIQYGYSIYEVETGFHTQFSFSNIGIAPATDVKIGLTYPAGTKIMRIAPSMKYTESEDDIEKHIELEIQSLGADRSLGVLVTSSHAPTAPPQVRCNEEGR